MIQWNTQRTVSYLGVMGDGQKKKYATKNGENDHKELILMYPMFR